MAAYFRLLDLTKVNGTAAQNHRDAIDVGSFSFVAMQVRVAELAGTTGILYVQHSAVLEEEGFVDYDPANVSVDLTTDENVTLRLEHPLRYVRVRWENVSTQAKLLVDSIAR